MNNTQINIQKIEKDSYSDQDWKNYFEIRKIYSEKSGEPLLFKSWKILKEQTILWLEGEGECYTVHDESKPIGFFSFVKGLKEDKEKQFTDYRGRLLVDFSKEIFSKIAECFLEYDPDSNFLIIKSANGEKDFLEDYINAEVSDYVEMFRLNVKQAKVDLIKDWYETYTNKFENYELKHYESIPDNILHEYCAVFTELLHDMPVESPIRITKVDPDELKKKEQGFKKNNQYSYRYLVFDKGKLIGMTNVSLNKSKPEIMQQYMTGTIKEYRRQGIGKWMKAAMYFKLTQDFPDLKIIKTETHPKNIGSKRISEKMGYEKVGFEKDLLISREKIIECLK